MQRAVTNALSASLSCCSPCPFGDWKTGCGASTDQPCSRNLFEEVLHFNVLKAVKFTVHQNLNVDSLFLIYTSIRFLKHACSKVSKNRRSKTRFLHDLMVQMLPLLFIRGLNTLSKGLMHWHGKCDKTSHLMWPATTWTETFFQTKVMVLSVTFFSTVPRWP